MAHVFEGGHVGIVGPAILFGLCEVDDTGGEIFLAFWKPNLLAGLKDGIGHNQSGGGSDVFGGKNNHSSCNIEWVLAGFNHSCKIVKGGIRLTSTHGFNES